ncbi:hypothetical protein [Geodermatophilus sp. DF01_2]|nr:hypothetical protein [Geodermatophilus sp. DF01_2]
MSTTVRVAGSSSSPTVPWDADTVTQTTHAAAFVESERAEAS